MPVLVCDCCQLEKSVQEVSIVRRWSKEKVAGGNLCKDCWDGKGPSFPVVYYP